MEHYPDQTYDGTELLDWLFDHTDGILRYEEAGQQGHQQHHWPVQEPNMLQLAEQADADFLNALLSGGESVSDSPTWSPSPSDSGISEDPPSDQMDSPQRPESPSGDVHCLRPRSQAKAALEAHVPIKPNAWKGEFPAERMKYPQYASDMNRAPPCSGSGLTVKDLLLSGTAEPPPQPFQQSIQELILNEDEKKLLAKEGVTLPGQLPLTKYEERILKKIRRKIRNKQSAQESRKKKKEYIDGLESRMATCSAHNQELQRKVSQLEKCNISLMEQLRRLQALVMNTSNKPAQTGTCVMVLLLSFSLILFPSLKPYADTKVSQGDFSPVRITVPAKHAGLPRAACHRSSVARPRRIQVSACAFPRRYGTGNHHPDGEHEAEPRIGRHVSEPQPGGKPGSFPRGSRHRPHSHCDFGSETLRRVPAER
uniref:cAMP responsive element binding protein 3-like 3a n=1 Tax=Hippocampus comes TaxID=109280 RepID=A0A3Q2X9S4_HIPCM